MADEIFNLACVNRESVCRSEGHRMKQGAMTSPS